MSTEKTNQSWGGRFSEPVDAFVARFTASVEFDKRLYRHDIMGSIAHATMLAKVGVLNDAERDAIVDGLTQIQSEIEAGQFDWRVDLEDVHMNIEARLTDRIGVTGKKLHTGRSRNDQVATDIRLWLRDEIDLILAEITRLQQGLLEQAEREAETIMPGFTHLQTAQPVTFGHHLLAWFEMLSRDYERLVDCRKRTNRMPLGSAALAGTTYPIQREITAQLLGFDAVGGNSLDGVSDRDFAIEFCAAASLAMMHLSRFSEELVLWTSAQFQFIDLPDRFCTGSSIMPQKRNPDAAELVRGRTATAQVSPTASLVSSIISRSRRTKGRLIEACIDSRSVGSRASSVRLKLWKLCKPPPVKNHVITVLGGQNLARFYRLFQRALNLFCVLKIL